MKIRFLETVELALPLPADLQRPGVRQQRQIFRSGEEAELPQNICERQIELGYAELAE